METRGERLKKIRQTLNLSQTEFGARLGLKKSVISHYECGLREVPEIVMKLLCQTYRVEYDYINCGEGNMFVSTDTPVLAALIDEYNLDKADALIIKAYIELSADTRTYVKEYLKKMLEIT